MASELLPVAVAPKMTKIFSFGELFSESDFIESVIFVKSKLSASKFFIMLRILDRQIAGWLDR